MLAKLNALRFRVNLWEHAFVHQDSPLYDALLPHAGQYKVFGGLVPDFSRAAAADAFAEYHRQALIGQGVDAFKLDECDSSDYTGAWSFPNSDTFPSGMDGEQMHSLLGVLYQKTLLEAFARAGKNTYGQARASHALAAPLPFALYSDLYDHKVFIRGVVNAGFSGLLWTPEVRQCDSEEDLLRRLQGVVFSAQALINGWMIPHPPWMQWDRDKNIAGEFLPDWRALTERCRAILEMRMRLIPYLYASFAEYRRSGLPPVRAMVMDYPDDPETYALDSQYMLGQSLLVAPVTAGEDARDIYLPASGWYDFWDNTRYEGGRTIRYAAGADTIPVFVKSGALLPLAEPVAQVDEQTRFTVAVRRYGGRAGAFTLYEDDEANTAVHLFCDENGEGSVRREGDGAGSRYAITEWISIV